MNSEYHGMRWFKCDLQVQTPEDARHWLDQDLRLGEPRRVKVDSKPDESGIQEKARQFLRACHASGLEVIGVTDHNLTQKTEPRDWFLVHLVEQRETVARELGVEPLVIFPGFEADIGYHLLCLFDPARKQEDIEKCNRVLTKLGLAEAERFDSSGPRMLQRNGKTLSLKDVLETVQNEYGGIVICAHADQRSGILKDSKNRSDFAQPELYAVELTSNPPGTKYQEILAGKNTEWNREAHRLAWIMSSDAKSLKRDQEGKPVQNSVGYRFTWIKMSEPSIEALRQAFLDSESRVRVPKDINNAERPDLRQRHARIASISVEDMDFLGTIKMQFSPNLNAIIGGRGTGKSAVLEAMRITMGRDLHGDLDEQSKTKVNRIRELIDKRPVSKKDPRATPSRILLRWRDAHGLEQTITYTSGGDRIIEDRNVADMDSYLREQSVLFFSQQQLNEITKKDEHKLLPLVDGFIRSGSDGDAFKQIQLRITEVRDKIRRIFSAEDTHERVRAEIVSLEQEIQTREEQLKVRQQLQDLAQTYEGARGAREYYQKILRSLQEDGDRLIDAAQDIAESHSPLGSLTSTWPSAEWFLGKDQEIFALKQGLANTILDLVQSYRRQVEELFSKDTSWNAIHQEIMQAEQRFHQACADQGVAPESIKEIQKLSDSRLEKENQRDAKLAESRRLEQEIQQKGVLWNTLATLWKQRYDLRTSLASGINKRTDAIELVIEFAGDDRHFLGIWNTLSGDRRAALGRIWEELGEKIHSVFMEWSLGKEPLPDECIPEAVDSDPVQIPDQSSRNDVCSIWHWISCWLETEMEIPDSVAHILHERKLSQADLRNHLQETMKQQWREACITDVSDSVDLILYRSERDPRLRAGSVTDGTLSDGQRNTATLALLLSQGDVPIVIDQPEDELDSRYLYAELVPLLRKLKNDRQIIVITHNANIPVNADAECIFALDTPAKATIPITAHIRAQGGLDRKDVTDAVLDILEGSDEAFRRRREKYHF